jgi:secondary thiamine-phosphate synthase enzyme
MLKEIEVKTSSRVEVVDITSQVEKVLRENRVKKGLLCLYVPHTTAGVFINENADPSVKRDIIKELNKVIPFDDGYAHLEGNAAAHIKSSLIGASECIPVEGGRPLLGTWQGLYFGEFDGPRRRRILVKVIEG